MPTAPKPPLPPRRELVVPIKRPVATALPPVPPPPAPVATSPAQLPIPSTLPPPPSAIADVANADRQNRIRETELALKTCEINDLSMQAELVAKQSDLDILSKAIEALRERLDRPTVSIREREAVMPWIYFMKGRLVQARTTSGHSAPPASNRVSPPPVPVASHGAKRIIAPLPPPPVMPSKMKTWTQGIKKSTMKSLPIIGERGLDIAVFIANAFAGIVAWRRVSNFDDRAGILVGVLVALMLQGAVLIYAKLEPTRFKKAFASKIAYALITIVVAFGSIFIGHSEVPSTEPVPVLQEKEPGEPMDARPMTAPPPQTEKVEGTRISRR